MKVRRTPTGAAVASAGLVELSRQELIDIPTRLSSVVERRDAGTMPFGT
jgi:hypothetical protein